MLKRLRAVNPPEEDTAQLTPPSRVTKISPLLHEIKPFVLPVKAIESNPEANVEETF